MIPLLLLVAWLVTPRLDADTFWFDETVSVYYAGGMTDDESPQTLPEVMQSLINEDLEDETNPPGYYLTLYFWIRLVGASELAIRALSLLAGMLALAFVYRIGREMHSTGAGLAAAALLGTCAFYLHYLHEARSYAIYSMLVVFSVWAYQRLIYRERVGWVAYAALTLGMAGLIYIHYLSTIFLVAAGVYHLLFAPKNARWWRITAAVIVGGALFLPWTNIALRSFGHVSGNEMREAVALTPLGLLGELAAQFSNASPLLLLLLLVAAVPGKRLMWFLFGFTLLLYVLLNWRVPFISDMHYLMAVFPLLALVAAVGVVRLRAWGAVALALWMAAGVWLTLRPIRDPAAWHLALPWDVLAEQVGPVIQPLDNLIFHLPDPDPYWIHKRPAGYYLAEMVHAIHLLESYTDAPPTQHTDNLRTDIEAGWRVWIVYDSAKMPSLQGRIGRDRTLTEEGMVACGGEQQFGTLRARLYGRAPDSDILAAFDADVSAGLSPWQPAWLEGGKYELMVATHARDAADPASLAAVLEVVDENGQIAVSYPNPFPDGRNGCLHYVVDANSVPPGVYVLALRVYNMTTEKTIPALADNADAEGRLPLIALDSTEVNPHE